MTSEAYETTRQIAVRLLDAKARSESELRSALECRNAPLEAIGQVIERFKEVGLLDDLAYAQGYVQGRLAGGKGARRISTELQQRGLAPEIIDQVLAELEVDAEYGPALRAAERKLSSLAGKEPHVIKRRLYAALLRRGYSNDLVSRLVAEVLADDGE